MLQVSLAHPWRVFWELRPKWKEFRRTRLATMYQIEEPFVVLADHILGLRGLALILYGALPANLAVLGALKVVEPTAKTEGWPILGLLALPVVVTSLLIRHRQKEWYVSVAFLNIRSVVTTILILACSISIYAAAQMARGTWQLSPLRPILNPHSFEVLRESILFGVLSLMVSSTLFMTLLSKGGDLPGLPSSKALATFATIRQELKTVQRDRIWAVCPEGEKTGLEGSVESLVEALEDRGKIGLPSFARASLEPLAAAVKDLDMIVKAIGERQDLDFRLLVWKVYFAPAEELTDGERDDREAQAECFNSLQSLRWSRWGS